MTSTKRQARLSINLAAEPAEALRDLMARKGGITATEAIRRALSVWKFVEDEQAAGHRLAIRDGDQLRDIWFQG